MRSRLLADALLVRLQGQTTREVFRFLLGGGLNTILSLTAYWVLLKVLPYKTAYTVSYALGIATSYFLNNLFVFRTRPSLRSALTFPLVYAVQYLAGLAVLWAWVSRLHFPKEWGAIMVVIVTLPLTFVLSRYVLRPSNSATPRGDP